MVAFSRVVAFIGCIQTVSECNLRDSLGERLKQARARLDLTQKELCLRIGLPLQSLKDYEGRKRLPGAEALCAYVRVGVHVDWLLTGEGPMLLDDLVGARTDRKADLAAAFDAFWHTHRPSVRRIAVAAEEFQAAYNAGQVPHIPGIPAVMASDVLAAYRVDKPTPAEIDIETLAVMIEGAIRARPNASPLQLSRMAVDFYLRTQALDAAKPDAA